MQTETQVIEVNGVKLEIDMRHAVRIEQIRIGDRVKVLVKGYSDSFDVHAGVVIGFEPFPDLPTILVAYLKTDYSKAEIVVKAINTKTKDVQIIKSVDDVLFDKLSVLKQFDKQIADHQRGIAEIEDRKRYFEEKFGTYWAAVQPNKMAS